MRVLSLFDGMSCGQIALNELNHNVEYYASEIDKHAILQTQLNFPDTIQLGDVTKWREWQIDWNFDLLLAGSPCQGFSFAGKQLAFDDPRSKLFFVFIDILNHIRTVNPNVKFLLENVRMKAEHEAVITQYVGVNPLYINSALVSAQNRERLYWTNIGMVQKGLFGEWYPGILQPEDRGILLRDILENEVAEKYYLSDKMMNYFNTRAANFNNGKINIRKEDSKASTITASCKSVDISDNFIKIDRVGNIKPNQQKASCFTAGAHSGGNHSDMDLLVVAQRGRGQHNEQQLEPNYTGKTNCLTSVQKDNLVITHNLQPRQGKGQGGKGHLQKYDQKSYCLDTGNCQAVEYSTRIRRLTPTECSRLQTIPDWYKWKNINKTEYIQCEPNAKSMDAINVSPQRKPDCATNIILDYYELALLNEKQLIKQCNAQLIDATECVQPKSMEMFALCTLKGLSGMEVMNYHKNLLNVNIVVEKGNMGMVDAVKCVPIITEVSKYMEIHLLLSNGRQMQNSQLSPEDIMGVRIIKKDTNRQWKITLGESLKKEKLYTISTLINWIIQSKIYTYVNQEANIKGFISNYKELQQNLSKMELSDLRMETIVSTSDTQQYRMLGNGWTIEVIVWILKHLNNK